MTGFHEVSYPRPQSEGLAMNRGGQSMSKDKRKVKPSTGHSPAIMGKGAPHRDRTKYTRKRKHDKRQDQNQDQ